MSKTTSYKKTSVLIGGSREAISFPTIVVAWPVQRKLSRCRKVQKSCNEHRDLFKNASLALYTIYNDVMSMKVYKVKVAHRESKFTIPSTDPA